MREYKISGYEITVKSDNRWQAWHYALTKLLIPNPLLIRQ